MTTPILLTGGTGTLGRLVAARLQAAGADLRILSRRRQPSAAGVENVTGDLDTGEGVEAAVADVATIVHLAGSAKGDEVKARTLVSAATAVGSVAHLVNISVVGADRIPMNSAVDRAMFGYFGEQHAAEDVVTSSGLPWTVLRATQFHQLLHQVLQAMVKLPVVPVPRGFRFQPIDAAEVADRLADLALQTPAGRAPDLGGPQVRGFDELVRSYLAAAGRRRPLLPLRLPGAAARAFRDGANLSPDRDVGRRTWDEFLAEAAVVSRA